MSKNSSDELYGIAMNTLRYVSENTEIGVFGAGWIASAAAKLGEGTAALRILYENGSNYFIHSNGLGYEESERYVNHCLTSEPPLYPPAMMEPSGGIVMAVNTMLLNFDDVIEVFPAVPNGTDNLWKPETHSKYVEYYFQNNYPAWEDCRFDGLLAKGGFEISAERRNSKAVYIKIHSLRGGTLRLLLPEELTGFAGLGVDRIYEKEMKPGETLIIGSEIEKTGGCEEREYPAVQTKTAANTYKRFFLGEDRHTEFYKAVDSLVCPYLLGFSIELPRGKYNMLIISEDETEESLTRIHMPHIYGNPDGEHIKAGRYQCKIIPFMQERDGLFSIGLSTEKGMKWKLNAIFLNKEYYY